MKQSILRLSILTLLLSLCPSLFAAYNFIVDGIAYRFKGENTVGVTYISQYDNTKRYKGNIVIPEQVINDGKTYNVTSIDDYAFDYCSDLTSVVIPNSVKSIGYVAFNGCSGLTSITIPNGVTSIGSSAFYECTGLTSVTIPNSVTSIGSSAFSECTGLTSVTIGNGVRSIGRGAFCRCTNLTSVTIGNCAPSIELGAFDCCNLTSLTLNCKEVGSWFQGNKETIKEVFLGDGVTSIGYQAFCGCIGLTSVNIPNSVTSIGESAFEGCNGLTSVILGYNVMSIGFRAFKSCTGLVSVTIPNNVKSIERYAFRDCTGLTFVTIGNSVTSIGYEAFFHCNLTSLTLNCKEVGSWFQGMTSIKEVAFGDGVTNIGSSAFSGCSSLTSVTIGNSVTSIGSSAFYGCSSLTSVTIGNSVKSIGNDAFRGCCGYQIKSLAQMPPTLHDKMDAVSMEVPIGSGCRYAAADYWNTIDTIYSIKGGVKQYPVLLSVDGESIVLVNGISELGVELEEGQEIIIKPNSTFADYDLVECNFTDIATNLAQFGKYSFIASSFYKDNIIKTCAYSTRTIQLKASGTLLNHIGTDSIDNVYSLKLSGDLNGTDILTIRKMPNLYMLDLRDANIVNGGMSYYQNYTTSENKIGEYFFTEIKNLKKIILPNTVTSIDNGAFIYCNSLTSVIIPNTVTSIGKYVFYGCGLVSVNIPNSVTSIGHSAFSFCTSLATVIIGKSVTTIENGTFSGCSNLASVTIPNSVTSIGDYAFSSCSGLTSVTIPNSVTSIGQSAFEGCDGLKSVTIPNSVTSIGDSAFKGCSSLTSATIGNSVPSIGKDAFRDCISLTSVTIGNSVTSIGSSAFYGCSSLKSVTIPNSVISIGSYSFLCCSGLTTVIIGNNVTTIGEWAFHGCSSLASVTSLNTTPPVINYSAFGETTEKNGTLYVPKGSKTIYWLHPYWENFKNIVEIDASDVDKVIVDTPNQNSPVYNLQGVKMTAKASDLESLPKGIYIVNGKKYTVK